MRPDNPTFPGTHGVLLAAKNMQALARLVYDLFPQLAEDRRLDIRFAVIPGSHFEAGAHELLRRLGLKTIPWRDVRRFRPSLIISGSPTRQLFKTGRPGGPHIPFIVVTHGAGNNRIRVDLSGVYGLAPEQLLGPRPWLPWRKRRRVDWLPLAGPAAMRQLGRDCPKALAAAEIVGDLAYERMSLSTDRRARYREAFGVRPDQRLVVVCSTWGDFSLVGRGRANLVELLLASLPMDEFRVAFIPHPNIENGWGPVPARVFAPQVANGLIMAPIDEGWRALLVAADVVIGDSGSTTQYGAAIGRPVLLGAFGFEQMPEDGALAEFGRRTPRFDLDKPYAPQLLEAIDRGQDFDFGAIIAKDRSPSGRIAAMVYEMLRISAWRTVDPKYLPYPDPREECQPTSSWNFTVRFEPQHAVWDRYPVSRHEEIGSLLVVKSACDDRRLWSEAEVLLRHDSELPEPEAVVAVADLLEDWPNARLVSVRTGPDTAVIGLRSGLTLGLRCDPSLLDIVPAALWVWLREHPADAARLGEAPGSLIGFDRRFEPRPALFAL